MELAEAREIAKKVYEFRNVWNKGSNPKHEDVVKAIIILDDRISKLEKERDELLGALDILNQDCIGVVQVIKTLETIKKIRNSAKNEINNDG